jgi:hypothetical protein
MYALYGPATQDLLTLDGRVIVHNNRSELEWVCPRARVVRVTERDLAQRSPLPPLPLPQHPALAGLSWPIERSEWRG